MQYQGCSAYCGLCALNNAYREERFTVEMLDNIADDLWLRQIEQLGMSLTSELQSLRDICGHYSIEVLRESVSRMSGSWWNCTTHDVTKYKCRQLHKRTCIGIQVSMLIYSCMESTKPLHMCPYSHINSVAFQFIEKTTGANITSTDESSSGG